MPVLAQKTKAHSLQRVHIYSQQSVPCPIKSKIERAAQQKAERALVERLKNLLLAPIKPAIEFLLNHAFAHSPWVAGKTAYDAVERAKSILLSSPRGSNIILCSLGEHTTSKDEVDAAVTENFHLIDEAHRQLGNLAKQNGIAPSIAIRPSTFGTEISMPGFDSEKYCFE
ncbi:MAG: hypothetical protein QW568_05485, partial [Candidatus Anstonellaceae archaeon]